MRYWGLFALFCAVLPGASELTAPASWKVVKDAKGSCQILIPEDWTISEHPGSAVFRDPSNGIAVVTSQPGQTFQPLTESLQKILALPKDKLFENSAKRIFYQDKISHNMTEPNAFSAMVPGNKGTCSARVVFIAGIPEETARKIVLSVGPVPE